MLQSPGGALLHSLRRRVARPLGPNDGAASLLSRSVAGDATTAGSVSNTSSATQVSHLEVEGKIGVAAVLADAEDVDVLVLEYFQGQRYGGSEQIVSVR